MPPDFALVLIAIVTITRLNMIRRPGRGWDVVVHVDGVAICVALVAFVVAVGADEVEYLVEVVRVGGVAVVVVLMIHAKGMVNQTLE